MLWKNPLIEVGRAAAADTPQYNPRGEKYLDVWRIAIAAGNLISNGEKMLSGRDF